MKYSHVLWDWNGTLLDDLMECIACVDTMLTRRGLPALGTVEAYHNVFCFPIRDYYARAGFDFARESFEALAAEYIDLYFGKAYCLHEGAERTLQSIRDTGVSQVILSATKTDLLERQVESMGVARYFDELVGIGDIYAKGKVDAGRAFLARAVPRRAVLIGDTEHDFEVASALGMDCILIARGHQSRARIEACGVPVLGDIGEVPAVIASAR